MSHRMLLFRPGFVSSNAPSKNGVGRYMCQLQRVTIKFCPEKVSSRGVRQFIQDDLVAFARDNPSVVVYLKPRKDKMPVIVAEYLNGERHTENLHNCTPAMTAETLDWLRSASGKELQLQKKYTYSDTPSVQGVWNSFTHAHPHIATTLEDPIKCGADLMRVRGWGPSASEKLIQMFKEQQEQQQEEREHQKQ